MHKILYQGQQLFCPKLDLTFKALFGNEQHKDILRAFLNAVLNLNLVETDQIELSNTELNPEGPDKKLSRMDLRVSRFDDDSKLSEQINIEIQLTNQGDMIKRSVFYLSRMVAEQLNKKEHYLDLGRFITLNILDFQLFGDAEILHRAHLKDVKTNEELTDCIEINFVELPKFDRKAKNFDDPKNLWLQFLTAEEEEDLTMLETRSNDLKTAITRLATISADEKLRFEYEMREKAIRDYYNSMFFAETKGLEQGRAEGRAEGRTEGIEIGASSASIRIAKNLKTLNLPISSIMQATGLSPEEIAQL